MKRMVLLTGPAGSGKTHLLLDDFERSLRESSDPLTRDSFFLLPSAEHTERMMALLLQRGVGGFFHRRITTFSRLISEIFEAGLDPLATNVTRYLILRELTEAHPWTYFGEVKSSPGFLNLMLGFIGELKESLISPAVFRERMSVLKTLEPDLAPKYEALAGFYEAYAAALSARGLYDLQDSWAVFQERKAKGGTRRPHFRKIWIDGFMDFSPLQLACLKELGTMTDEMTVTLTLEDGPEREDLFRIVHHTQSELLAMGFQQQTQRRRPAAGALGVLEQHLFSGRRGKAEAGTGQVAILEAVGLEGEVEMIARKVLQLHRREGWRFSDFAVLVREISGYDAVIRSVFGRYGIPVELHERERLKFSPALQPVAALLKIFRDGWKAPDLFAFLKSSYVRELGGRARDPEWAAALEHHAFRAGVFGGREHWLKRWPQAAEEESFHEKKKDCLESLALLEEALRGARNFQEFRRLFLRALTETFGIFSGLEGTEEPVRRDAASWKRIGGLFEEIEASFENPEPEVSLFDSVCDRFFRLVDLDLYSLHDRDRNRVQVYTVSLARQKEYRVVFVAGLLERRFPVQVREDPLLSDWERRLVNGAGPASLLRERLSRQSQERYLFYVAVTRAREKLFLSFPRVDLEGRESLPSYYLEEASSLFSGGIPKETQPLGRPFPALEDAADRRELEMAVLGEFWRPVRETGAEEPLLLAAANMLLAQEETRGRLAKAFFEVQDILADAAIAAADPFRSLKTSPTRLEEYAKCPFRYYARFVLGLEDPEEDKNAMARGKILHEVLELGFGYWKKNPAAGRDRKKGRALTRELFEAAWKKYPLVLDKAYRYDLERDALWEMLETFLDREFTRLETAPLQPAFFELGFGDDGELPPLEISDEGHRILIRGKIDRIDTDASGKKALVLDYKTGAAFDAGALKLGTALQLPLYVHTLQSLRGLEVIGAELYTVADGGKKGFYKEAALDAFPGLSARRMILDSKAFDALIERALAYTRFFSRGMRNVEMPVKPRNCSDYCPFPPVCRIQKWKLPLIVEDLRREDRNSGLAETEPVK